MPIVYPHKTEMPCRDPEDRRRTLQGSCFSSRSLPEARRLPCWRISAAWPHRPTTSSTWATNSPYIPAPPLPRNRSAGSHGVCGAGRATYRKNGFSFPFKPNPRAFVDMALHPRWWWHMLTTPRITFANVAGKAGIGVTLVTPEQRGDVSVIARQLKLEEEFQLSGMEVAPPRLVYATTKGRRSALAGRRGRRSPPRRPRR